VSVELVPVEAAGDPRLRHYRDLTDVALRSSVEAAEGLFIAEGELVIRRAIAAGYQVHSFLMTPKWVGSMTPLAELAGAPMFVAGDAAVQELTGFQVHRGALAAVRRPPALRWQDVAAGAHRLAVLEDVNTHTNVGAIVRAAAALGVDGVLLSPRCADPLYRRAVRVSMGAVFSVPWARMTRWPDDLDELRRLGLRVWALTPAADAVPLHRLAAPDRVALLLGAEGDGLTPAALDRADLRTCIPMARGVDSLNVAAAAAVAFYAVHRPGDGAAPLAPALSPRGS
jgi:tRNA G18 (ribose-2'-O)-methylase SpoU